MHFSILLFLLLCVFQLEEAKKEEPKTNIGLIFEDNNSDLEKVFQKAIETVNEENPDLDFRPVSNSITYGNTFEMSKKLCKMLRAGVIAVFGPTSSLSAAHAISVCDAKEVPYMDTRWDFTTENPIINLHPHPSQIAIALTHLVNDLGWNDFTILYESGEYLGLINELLEMYDTSGPVVAVRRYELELNGNYRNVLRRIKKSSDNSILIVGSTESIYELLLQAQQVGILTESYRYIIGNLDFHTLNLEPFQHSEVNITSLRMISPEDPRVFEVLKSLVEPDEDPFRNTSCPMTINMALVYDGVHLLAETFKHAEFQSARLNCNDDSTWDKGYTLVNYLKSINYHGITGDISFDHQGLRTNFELDIVELTPAGIAKVGTWKTDDGVAINRDALPTLNEADTRSLANKSFIVITALSDPYGMLKNTSLKLTGNDQYEGFGIELIQKLSEKLGFNYTFTLQEDGAYGSLNEVTKEWSGMVKEILENRADLAITDLTMTSDRESAVDFTIPFMNLGIAILYKKPMKEAPKLFSFMSPFSGQVWLYLGVACFSVSMTLFILGRLSPGEWDNPYPCIQEPTELENQLSFANSIWFTMGALLQQGSEIAPKTLSTRTVSAMFAFFTLIMVSSYTANLAAFLTVESLSSPIENIEDLANQKGGVQYGAKKGGSTLAFFRDAQYPTYQKMYQYMKAHPELLTSTNPEGVIRAEKENYAFLMESTTIEYIVERHCTLTQVGSLLDEKGYGIAMRKNWPYRNALSLAILELQEQGVLAQMKTKWWKEKRGGGACSTSGGDSGAVALELANLGGVYLVLIVGSFLAVIVSILEMLIDVWRRSSEYKQSSDSNSAKELTMANLGGVYFVMLVGSCIASCFGILEWLFNVYKTSLQFKVPFKEELIEELKFIIRCSGNSKPVRHGKSQSESSRNSSITMGSLESENMNLAKMRHDDQATLTI